VTLYSSALNQFMSNINQFMLKPKSHDTEGKESEEKGRRERGGGGGGLGERRIREFNRSMCEMRDICGSRTV
jgi:hypothetical protein